MLQFGPPNLYRRECKTRSSRVELVMLEVYLFVNPIDDKCFRTEKEIFNVIAHSKQKIALRLIPLLNFQTITDYMQTSGYCVSDIKLRNQLTNQLYAAALDFKAALFQGRKLGHQFLLELQSQIATKRQPYNDQLALAIAQKVGLDSAMFCEDRKSSLAKQAVQKAQQLAADMSVVTPPTTVIYQGEAGVLIPECNSAAFLNRVIAGDVNLATDLTRSQRPQLRRTATLHN